MHACRALCWKITLRHYNLDVLKFVKQGSSCTKPHVLAYRWVLHVGAGWTEALWKQRNIYVVFTHIWKEVVFMLIYKVELLFLHAVDSQICNIVQWFTGFPLSNLNKQHVVKLFFTFTRNITIFQYFKKCQ